MKVSIDSIQGRRSKQQDYVVWKAYNNCQLFIVCDGMGGAGPESELIAKAVADRVIDSLPKTGLELKEAIEFAGRSSILEYRGGTTIVALLITPQGAYVSHVGDSRLYSWIDQDLKQLTKDQTRLQDLVDEGVVSQEDADECIVQRGSNILTNCIGAKANYFHTSLRKLKVSDGDTFILATDGVWGFEGKSWLKDQLNKDLNASRICKEAFISGSEDNISMVIVTIE